MATTTPYTLQTPCSNCPFRANQRFPLTVERVDDIANSLRSNGSDFYCHKTTGSDEETGETTVAKKSRVCAGSLITMENEGISTQSMRIAERLGLYDPTKLDTGAPVYESLEAWQRSYRPDPTEDDLEHCGVVGPDCEDPPRRVQLRG